jgi:hypothetical protein
MIRFMFSPLLFGRHTIPGRRIALRGLKTGKFGSQIAGDRYGRAEELPTKIHKNLALRMTGSYWLAGRSTGSKIRTGSHPAMERVMNAWTQPSETGVGVADIDQTLTTWFMDPAH